MPAAGLRRRFHEVRRSREGKISPADLLTLAHRYVVSVEARVLRLEELGLVPTGREQRRQGRRQCALPLEELRLVPTGTWNRLRTTWFRVREAQAMLHLSAQVGNHVGDDQLLPTSYLVLATEAYERGEFSEGQYAQFLRVDRLEARCMAETATSCEFTSPAPPFPAARYWNSSSTTTGPASVWASSARKTVRQVGKSAASSPWPDHAASSRTRSWRLRSGVSAAARK